MPLPFLATLASAVVPALAKRGMDLLGGVFNGAADKGVETVSKLIEEKTGIRVQEIAEEKLSDEQWGKLKEFELRHQELLLKELEIAGAQGIDRLRLANEDRAGARVMQQTAMQSPDWLTRNFIYVYALLITVLTFGFIGWVVFGNAYELVEVTENGVVRKVLSEASQARGRVIDTVLGFLLGVSLSAVIQFFFGSSAGSSQKNQTIAHMLERSAPGNPDRRG